LRLFLFHAFAPKVRVVAGRSFSPVIRLPLTQQKKSIMSPCTKKGFSGRNLKTLVIYGAEVLFELNLQCAVIYKITV
jgi:hypothetical protein